MSALSWKANSLCLFNEAHLQRLGQELQAWMLSQITDTAAFLDPLVCDSTSSRGSAIATEEGTIRLVTQATMYACTLGVVIAQTAVGTLEH